MATNDPTGRGLGPGSRRRGPLRQGARNLAAGYKRNRRARGSSGGIRSGPSASTGAQPTQPTQPQPRSAQVDTSSQARASARETASAQREQFRNSGRTHGSSSGPRQSSGASSAARQADVTVDRSNPPSRASRLARGLGRGVGAGLRTAAGLNPVGAGLYAMTPLNAGAGSDEPIEGSAMNPISDERRAQLRRTGATNPLTGEPVGEDEDEVSFEELSRITAGVEDSLGPGERTRLSPDRENTVDAQDGPAGIRSARADTQRATELQEQTENFAPSLPGEDAEQDIITMEDGEGGSAAIRAPAGMRRGGGTVSSIDGDVAAAAAPVDTAGLRRARQAAADRGDWEAVERSYMSPAERRAADRENRKERLRDQIESSEGLDQSLGGIVQEGIRRRANQQELDQMNAEDMNARQRQAQLRRTQLQRQPTAMDQAEFLSDQQQQQRENQRAQRDEVREVFDRKFTSTDAEGNEVMDARGRNRAESLYQRMGGNGGVQAAQQIADLASVTQELNQEAGESWETPIIGGLVDWFRTGPSTSPQAETDDMVQSLRNLKEAGVSRERRSRRGAPWPFEKDVVTWRGQDVNLEEIPAEEREVVYSIIDRIPDDL